MAAAAASRLAAAAASRREVGRKETTSAVKLINASSFGALDVPWPRCQAVPESLVAHNPSSADLLLAVSHGWPYQVHPDPLGHKVSPLQQLLQCAIQHHRPIGRSLVFLDYLSISQLPRTSEEAAQFEQALASIPWLYVEADAVLHLDLQLEPHPADGEPFTLPASALAAATFLQVMNKVQVLAGLPRAQLYSFVSSVDAVPVDSVEQLEALIAAAAAESREATVLLHRAEFGRYNQTPTSERGWVYLERFCSMIKAALVDPVAEVHVAFSNNPAVLEQIYRGSAKLREAAGLGTEALGAALGEFVAELKSKRFGGASTDKLLNPVGLSRRMSSKGKKMQLQRSEEELEGDAAVVATLMKRLAANLPLHWKAERIRQRQRQLTLAVRRGDPLEVTELLRMGAQANERDEAGQTPLHLAAQHCNADIALRLLEHSADPLMQDVQGNTPAHLVPAYSHQSVVDTFRAVAVSEAVLTVRNRVRVSALQRFEHWALHGSSAADGSDGRFAPAVELVAEIYRSFPGLEHLDETSVVALPDVDSGAAAHSVRTCSVPGWEQPVRLEVWSPVRHSPQLHVLWVHGYMPVSLALSALQRVANAVCEKHKADIAVVSLLSASVPLGSALEECMANLCLLFDTLRPDGRYLLVENWYFPGLAWRLRDRLSGLLCINPSFFFEKDFIESDAFMKFVAPKAEAFLAAAAQRSVPKLVRCFSRLPFTFEEQLPVWEAEPQECLWEYVRLTSNAILRGQSSNLVDNLQPLELPSARVVIAVNTLAGANAAQLPAARLHSKLMPGSRLEPIPNSGVHWSLEGDKPVAQIIRLLDELLREAAIREVPDAAGT